MGYYSNQSQQDNFMGDFADYMTNGRYSFFRRIFNIFINANAMLLLMILNKNIGLQITRRSDILSGVLYLIGLSFISGLAMDFDLSQGITDEVYSLPLLWYHGWIFIVFAIWRRLGSWWNMRNSGKPDYNNRLPYGIGDSVIYPVIRFFLKPIGLIDNEKTPKTRWKMNEARWMQIWQPLMLVGIAIVIILYGFETYGIFLLIANLCFTYLTVVAFDNTAKVRQGRGTADELGKIADPDSPEDDPHIIGD